MADTTGKINVVAVANTGDHDRGMQKMTKTQERAARATKKTNAALNNQARAGKKVQTSMGSAFGSRALSNLTSYAVGLVGISSGIAAVVGGFAELKAVQEGMNSAQVKLAKSQDLVAQNFIGTQEEFKRLLLDIKKLSREVGLGEDVVGRAVASGLTASFGDVPGTKAAVKKGAAFLASTPEGIPDFVGSILDFRKITESEDPDINFGLFKTTAAFSRVVNPRLQSGNIATGLIGATAFGAKPSTAAALFTSLSSAGIDPTGKRTGTGEGSIARFIDEQFRENPKFKKLDKAAGGLTFLERLDALSDLSIEDARQFVKETPLEGKLRAPFFQLLTDPKSAAREAFEKTLAATATDEQLRTNARESIEFLRATPQQRLAIEKRKQQQIIESGKTRNVVAGQKAQARDTVNAAIELGLADSSPGGAFLKAAPQRIENFIREFAGQDIRRFGAEQIRGQAGELRKGQRIVPTALGSAREDIRLQPTPHELNVAALLTQMAGSLDSLDAKNETFAQQQEQTEQIPATPPIARNAGIEE